MKSCSAGTFIRKSSASSTVHISAPTATSTTRSKPSSFMAVVNFSGVEFFPNCPMKAGATMATTFSFSIMERITWKICPLSTMAPKGQLTRHCPQATHLS